MDFNVADSVKRDIKVLGQPAIRYALIVLLESINLILAHYAGIICSSIML